MEEGEYYFIVQHIIGSVGFFLKLGLEKKLFDKDYKGQKKNIADRKDYTITAKLLIALVLTKSMEIKKIKINNKNKICLIYRMIN